MSKAKLPDYLLGKYQLTGTIPFSVLFAIVFLNIYIPFSDTAWFRLGDSVMFLLTVAFVVAAIILLIGSRVVMYKTKKLFEMTYVTYIIWCCLEIIAICGMYTAFTIGLTSPGNESALVVFSRALLYGAIALGVPYIISAMYFAIIDKNEIIRLMNYDNVVTDEVVKPQTKKITLFDNSGSLKLSLSFDNLYYIESCDNYIKVWYTDNKGEMQQYLIRCRLRSVEEKFLGTSLVRTNRKYIVNMSKVKVLRKESDGYILDLENETIPPLPVTKTYTENVLTYFTGELPILEPIDF